MPNLFTVKNWFKKTPEHFRFTAKFPKSITHDKRLKNISKELEYFHKAMLPLKRIRFFHEIYSVSFIHSLQITVLSLIFSKSRRRKNHLMQMHLFLGFKKHKAN